MSTAALHRQDLRETPTGLLTVSLERLTHAAPGCSALSQRTAVVPDNFVPTAETLQRFYSGGARSFFLPGHNRGTTIITGHASLWHRDRDRACKPGPVFSNPGFGFQGLPPVQHAFLWDALALSVIVVSIVHS